MGGPVTRTTQEQPPHSHALAVGHAANRLRDDTINGVELHDTELREEGGHEMGVREGVGGTKTKKQQRRGVGCSKSKPKLRRSYMWVLFTHGTGTWQCPFLVTCDCGPGGVTADCGPQPPWEGQP